MRYTRDPWQVWIVGTMDCCNNELKYQGRSLKNSMWSETEPTKRANVRTADSNSVLMVAIDFRFSKG